MKKFLPIFAFLLIFLFSTSEIKAQEVVIGDFYSLGTNKTEVPDWIEVKNTRDTDIEITGYKIEDTAPSNPLVYDWKEKTIIPGFGFCVVEVDSRLNKDGDTIYLKNTSGSQIDCVAYGDGNGGICSSSRNPVENPTKPASNCFSPTPTPTASSTQAPTATPTPTPVSTAIPTKTPTPTPKKTSTPLQTTSGQATSEETATSQNLVLGLQGEDSSPSPVASVEAKNKIPFLSFIFIFLGLGFIGGAGYLVFRKSKGYNGTHEENKENS